jgi:transmembrane sensor
MTDAAMERQPQSHAARIEQRAAEWLEQRAFGQWTQSDAAALDAWLGESVDHQIAFYRLEFGWDRTARLSALRFDPPRESKAKPRDWMGHVKPMAAAVAIAALCAGGVYQYAFAPQGTVYSTDIGGRKILKLPDGSRIELNTNTSVRLAADGTGRKVWLAKGEAFFQVRHDAAHPFIVMVGDHVITDLGTKFLVRRRPDGMIVSLIEGSARVEAVGGNAEAQATDLKPGDVARATHASVSVSHAQVAKLETALGWRHGVLIFHDTSLADAAAEFNRYNRRQLVVSDPAVARLTVDGTFPSARVETFARLARDVLGLRVENKGDRIVIAR